MNKILVFLLVLAIPGCATIFSGSSQKVTVTATPSDSTIIVLGGATGAAVAKIGKVADLQQRVLGLLHGELSAEDRELIAAVGIERFITGLIVEVKTGQTPAGTTEELARLYERIPRPIKDRLVSTIGLEAFGVGRVDVELDRGEIYAVIGWRAGADIEIKSIDGSFNWTTLWNVLNFGLGVPVDLYTGAWLKLAPPRLELRLEPISAASSSTTSDAAPRW
ncbi:MAG: hypothetical protein K8M05_29490 [Deltaproteobacteria bacterium]|nr:hypothetical protein [Kofleriaceae bacterium]